MGSTHIATQFTFKVFLEVVVMDKGLELLMDRLTKEYMEAVKVLEYNEDISGTEGILEQEVYDYIKGNLDEVSVEDMEQETGLYARIFIALSEYYRYDSLKECYMDLIGDTVGLEDFVDYLVNVNGLGYYVSHRDGKMIYLGNDDDGEKLWTVRV